MSTEAFNHIQNIQWLLFKFPSLLLRKTIFVIQEEINNEETNWSFTSTSVLLNFGPSLLDEAIALVTFSPTDNGRVQSWWVSRAIFLFPTLGAESKYGHHRGEGHVSEQLEGAVPGRLCRTWTVGLLCWITAFHCHENTCKVTMAWKLRQRHSQALSKHAESGREMVKCWFSQSDSWVSSNKTLIYIKRKSIDSYESSSVLRVHLLYGLYHRAIMEKLNKKKTKKKWNMTHLFCMCFKL